MDDRLRHRSSGGGDHSDPLLQTCPLIQMQMFCQYLILWRCMNLCLLICISGVSSFSCFYLLVSSVACIVNVLQMDEECLTLFRNLSQKTKHIWEISNGWNVSAFISIFYTWRVKTGISKLARYDKFDCLQVCQATVYSGANLFF